MRVMKIQYSKAFILLFIFIMIFNCGKKSSEPSTPEYTNIAGEYEGNFSFDFDEGGYSGHANATNFQIIITQDGAEITVENGTGTIDKEDNVIWTGSLVAGGGTQNFTGKYSTDTKAITGTFTGTARIYSSFHMYWITVTVQNGEFTLTYIE